MNKEVLLLLLILLLIIPGCVCYCNKDVSLELARIDCRQAHKTDNPRLTMYLMGYERLKASELPEGVKKELMLIGLRLVPVAGK